MQLINFHKSNYTPDIFTEEQIDLIFDYLKSPKLRYCRQNYGNWAQYRNYCICALMYDLAARPSEILRIKLCELDFKERKVMINSKNNHVHKGRVMVLSKDIINLIQRYLSLPLTKKYMKGYLFPTCENPYMTIDSWKDQFQNILKGAGIYKEPMRLTHGHYSSYTFRHTKATLLYLQTKDLELVANYLGHTTFSSTMVYIHLAKLASGYYEYMRRQIEIFNSNTNIFKPIKYKIMQRVQYDL
jgi:integrase/recombinase XerD